MATVAETTNAVEQREVQSNHSLGALPTAEAGSEFGGPLSGVFTGALGEPPADTTARLSHPSLSHPANASFRSIAFKRAQQAHGNHFVQRAMMLRNPSSSRTIQRECACGGTCSSCQASLSTPALPQVEVGPVSTDPVSNRTAQRKANSDSSTTERAKPDLAIPVDKGEPLAESLRKLMESRFGRDLSDVRIHNDDSASASAEALNANAYTSGRDIYFAAGKYAPQTAEGQHLLAHELTHTVQQSQGLVPSGVAMPAHEGTVVGRADDPMERAADRVADAVTAGKPVEDLLDKITGGSNVGAKSAVQRDTKDAKAPVGPSNPEYVNKYSTKILSAISDRIQTVGVPQPHARVWWIERAGAAQAIGAAIWDYVKAVSDTDLKRLMMLSYPADLFALVDHARRGPEGIRLDVVKIAVATAFDEPLRASILRMGTRLCVQMDIEGGMRPKASSLVASSPLDSLIAEVLVKSGLTSYTPKKKGAGDDTGGKPFAKGARVVQYEWQGRRDPSLWNWIKVTSPADATAEDVANTALAGGEAGDTTQAYRIAASPPYFGIPFETARLVPEAERYAPIDLRVKLSSGPGPRVADPSVLGRSAVSDDAALAQAPAPKKDDLGFERALERTNIQLEFLNAQLRPWHAEAPLAGAADFVNRRYADLAHDKKKAQRWQPALAAQERILHAAASEIAEVLQAVTNSKATPANAAELAPVMQLISSYARAAGVSHLHAEATAALSEARRFRDLLPLILAEERIRGASEQISEQRQAEVGAAASETGAEVTLQSLPDLMTRSANMRLQVARGAKLDPDDVEQLSVDASETDLRAYLLTLATQTRAVMRKADDVGLAKGRYPGGEWSVHMVSELILKNISGWQNDLDKARKWTGPITGLSPKQTDAKRMRDAVGQVSSQLSRFSKELNSDGDFRKWANERIADQELSNLILKMALQLGVMLLTGQVVGAAGAALRGLAMAGEISAQLREVSLLYKGAGILAEAAVNTGVQGALGEKVGVREFAENTLGIVLTNAALKPFQGLLKDSAVVEGEIRTWGQLAKKGGRAAAELVIDTGAGIGAAGIAHAVTHGGEMSAMSAEEWVTQGLSIAAGKFVQQRTMKMHERITIAAHELKSKSFDSLLSRVEALRTRAARKNHSPEEALELLKERHKLLVEEQTLYGGRQEAKRAHAAAEADLAATGENFVDAPLQLANLSPVVEGQIYEGTAADIKRAVDAVSASSVKMTPVGDPHDGIWQVGNRTIEIHEIGSAKSLEKRGTDSGSAEKKPEPGHVGEEHAKAGQKADVETPAARASATERLPGEKVEALPEVGKGGEARVTKEGHCKICSSPCQRELDMAREILHQVEPEFLGYAENLHMRIQLLEDAMAVSSRRGTLDAEYNSRYRGAVQKLSKEIYIAHRRFVGREEGVRVAAAEEIEGFSGQREGIMDDPRRYQHGVRQERALEGTAYHERIEARVAESLPHDSAFTENTIQAYLERQGVDPAVIPKKSTGIDLYIFDNIRNVMTPVDIINVAGGKKHVEKLHKDVAKLRDALEKVGIHLAEPIEIEYVGRTFNEAADSIATELRAFARAPAAVGKTTR
jgi:hypothetical protein